MTAASLVVRADGGPGIGFGHLGRCLALTQAWVDSGGRATLISSSPPAAWSDRYRREGATVCEPSEAPEGGADWAVLDGYGLGEEDEAVVRKAALRLLVIDDHGTGGGRGADLVVDQNLGASAVPYEGETLLGPRYALLRREFRPWHDWAREIPEHAQQLLVALGGSPPEDVTALVNRALGSPALRGMDVTWLEGVEDVASAMAGADLALSASGATCWELCCMALPAVVLPIAANQEPLALAMHSNGAAEHAGLPSTITAAELAARVIDLAGDFRRRADLARRGPELVDGRGARRVVARMRSELIELRPVRQDDARLLWEWVNDPSVRASAFNVEPIRWETHVRWLAGRLRNPSAHLYLASGPDGTLLGQVRFEGDASEVEISVSVASSHRGGRWGAPLIDAAVRRLFEESVVERVIARVKPENGRSQSAFEDTAFVRDAASTAECVRYVRERPTDVLGPRRRARQDGEIGR